MIYNKTKNINLKNKKHENREILEAEGKIYGIGIKIIVVYFDVDKGEEGKKSK